MTEDLVLKFEIVPGRAPKLETVAQALEAWADILKTAAEIVDPESTASIELIGVEEGSQLFLISLKKMQAVLATIKAGGEEYSDLYKLMITLATLVAGGVIATISQIALQPPPRIPDDQMAEFAKTNTLLQESNELQRKTMRFYGILQDDQAVESVKVLRGVERNIFYEVPRSEFANRAGLWGEEPPEAAPAVEKRYFTWEVTLIKPVLVAEPRRWVFLREGLPFSALMADKRVLEAIHDKTLPIQVAEGFTMTIEGEYKERNQGGAWIPIERTRKVTRVLRPVPPSRSGPLFLEPDEK